MSKLFVQDNITLDGVMQAPGRPEEDTRGGFREGGWAIPYQSRDPETIGRVLGERIANTRAILLGRRTYEDFAGYWPQQKDNPFSAILDATPKYVASTTLADPLPWQNSTVLKGDVPEAVRALKEQAGGDVVVLGSGELTQTLMRHGLVDEYLLLIHPLVLGTGRRLFPDGCPPARLTLTDSVTTSSGILIATFRPEEATR